MEKYRINWYADHYEYGRYHVLDKPLNFVYQFQNIEDLELLKIKKETSKDIENDEATERRYVLDNNQAIAFNEEVDSYKSISGTEIYHPVYDVKNAVDEQYSFYEEEDLIGFVKASSIII